MHAHVHLFTSHHLHFLYPSLNHRRYRRALARLVRAFLSLPPRCTGHKRFRVLPSLTASLWVRFEAESMKFCVGAVTSNCSLQVFGVCNRCKRRCKGSNSRRSEGASEKKTGEPLPTLTDVKAPTACAVCAPKTAPARCRQIVFLSVICQSLANTCVVVTASYELG